MSNRHEPRVWKKGERISWSDSIGTYRGTVVSDQTGDYVRVKPDHTEETGAIPIDLVEEQTND